MLEDGIDTTKQHFRGVQRTWYDLTQRSAWQRMALDKEEAAAALATIKRHLDSGAGDDVPPRKRYRPPALPPTDPFDKFK